MSLLFSICIPTINRTDYLLQALNSILTNNSFLDRIEICISNNCSETDYSEVESFIKEGSNLCKIKYFRHDSRIPLDENHQFVVKMASTEYIYFLGDDDYFLRDQIQNLVAFIQEKNPDLAVFNGFVIDSDNIYLGEHFNLPPREYLSLAPAFRDLRDKCSFGAVLVNKNLLQEFDFKALYGTDHAYGCFWLSIFRKYERNELIKIYVPDFPCVAIRSAQKTYNHIYVYYKTIPHWLNVYKKLAGPGIPQQLINEYIESTYELISSFKFLLSLIATGYNLHLIEDANPLLYKKYKVKILTCMCLYATGVYQIFKMLYKKIIKNKQSGNMKHDTAVVNYLISSVHKKNIQI